jgi:anti-anti-sigma factor
MNPTSQISRRVIEIDGDMDALMVKQIRSEFEDVVNIDKGDVTLDMTRVEFIDSSGLGALVFLFKRLTAASRQLEIKGVHGQPRDMFAFLRVDQAIPVQTINDSEVSENRMIAAVA